MLKGPAIQAYAWCVIKKLIYVCGWSMNRMFRAPQLKSLFDFFLSFRN